MKILHLGVYNRNIGDNIALYNIRKAIDSYRSDIEWVYHTIQDFWNRNNDPSYTVKVLNKYNANLIIVGGGGLIEQGVYSGKGTGYKLPFNKDILQQINCPVVFYGVGVNEFRGNKEYSEKASKAIQEIINHSAAFSVRNDGSLGKLSNTVNVNTDKVKIVPDPGLLYLEYLNIPYKLKLGTITLQPAFNSNSSINKNRFNNKLDNFKKIFANYSYLPHVDKDFEKAGKNSIVPKQNWKDLCQFKSLPTFLEFYKQVDGVVAMRGHGQLITIGANIPGIYFSTQDKLLDFSNLNGFEKYNVDIQEINWEQKLVDNIENLRFNNNGYLEEWYHIRELKLPNWYSMNNKFIEENVLPLL